MLITEPDITVITGGLGFFALIVVGVLLVVGAGVGIFTALKPHMKSSSPVALPVPSLQVRLASASYLRGQGAVVEQLHQDVATWLADPTTASCHVMVAKSTTLGTPDAIDAAIGASPDPVLIDIGADEISLLHVVTSNCTTVSSSERDRVAKVDVTLGRRLAQLSAARGRSSQ